MKVIDLKKQIVKELSNVGIKSAEIDVQILLEKVSGKSREFLLANPEYKLKNQETEELKNLVERRKKHEPIAYITGHKEFYSLDFLVTKDVLIPRPETEILVEEGLKFLESRMKDRELGILDIGTGSGNIIISIAKTTKELYSRFDAIDSNRLYVASDISEKALKVAKKNAKKHGVEKTVKFVRSDLFDQITGKFDLITANLPYVPISSEKRKAKSGKQEIDFEPQDAIFAESNGAEIIKKFLNDAKNHINSDGIILAEVDPRNADEIRDATSKIYKSVEIISDFSGKKRLLKILT